MRQVTKDRFYEVMMPCNVHPSPQGKWPYTTDWKTPSGAIIGRVIGSVPSPERPWPPRYEYFLPEKSGGVL